MARKREKICKSGIISLDKWKSRKKTQPDTFIQLTDASVNQVILLARSVLKGEDPGLVEGLRLNIEAYYRILIQRRQLKGR